jgi:Family of unknown function (DUF6428)
MDPLSLGAARRSAGAARPGRVAGVDDEKPGNERRAPPAQKGLLQNQPKKTEGYTMKTNEFIAELRRAPENQLVFVDGHGHAVHAGYHLTELKAASLDTVDCGGQANQWQETIVQLWVPANADNNYMSADKSLKIFDKVRGMIPLNFDAAIRVEYGDENFFPSTYDVRSITHAENVTCVLLQAPETTCKARDRRHRSTRSEAERETCCNAVAQSCC